MSNHTQTEESCTCPAGENCTYRDQVLALRKENAQLSEQLITDPLTELFNFRHFIYALDQEMERSRRSAQATSLIMLDIDHFKKVNDTHGHDTGNKALKLISRIIRQLIRQLDIACRYGGEEFALILPSTDLLIATKVAERLRIAIEQASLPLEDGNQLKLTASMGVGVFRGTSSDTPEDFIKRSDQELYRAKNAGRNQVCRSQDIPVAPSVTADEKEALHGLFGNDTEEEKEE